MTLQEIEANSNVFYYSPIDLNQVPVSALTGQTRIQLSCMLNKHKILLSDSGNFRDWRGLFICLEIDSLHWSGIDKETDPTKKILQIFEQKPIDIANLRTLQDILGQIDRWDIVDDLNLKFCKSHKQKHEL